MADNLTITIGADATKMRAELAVAQSEMRAFTRELNSAANTARRVGDELSLARVGQAAALFDQASGAVARLKTELSEAGKTGQGFSANLLSGVGGLKETLAGLAGAFAIHEIGSFVREMNELGEKSRNASFTLGLTIRQIGELSGMAMLAGGDFDTMQRTLERLARSVQQTLVNSNSQAATSFRNLGISAAEVKTHANDLPGLLALIVERVSELQPGMQRTAELHELLGRGMDRLAPLMSQGAAGYEELKKGAQGYADTLNVSERNMLRSAEAGNLLLLDLKTLAIDGFRFIEPVVTVVTLVIDDFVKTLDNAIKTVEAFLRMADAALGYAERALGLPDLSNTGPHALTTLPEVTVSGTRPVGTAKAGKGGASDLAAEMHLRIAEAGEDTAKIAAIWQEWLAKLAALYGQDGKEYRNVAVEKIRWEKHAQEQVFSLATADASAQQRIDSLNLAAFTRNREAEVAAKTKTVSEAITADLLYTAQLYEGERARLENIMQNIATTKAQRTKMYEDLAILGARFDAQQASLREKAAAENRRIAEAWAAPFKRAFDQVGSSIESSLASLLDRSRTMAQIWADIAKSTTSAGVGLIGSLASKGAASALGAKSGEGLGDYLGTQLLAAIGLGSPTQTGLLIEIAANTGIMAAASGTSAVTGAASAAGSAGGLLSGLTTAAKWGLALFAAPETGGASLALAAGTGGLYSKGGIVPSAAGGWALPSFPGMQPAMLHSREMVLPAHISEGLQNMIGKGGGGAGDTHLHFHGPADAPSIERMFRGFMSRNPGAIRDMLRSNALTPRTI